MAFASFMSSAAGRALRIVAGLGLIGWGAYLAVVASNMTTGMILVVVGLLTMMSKRSSEPFSPRRGEGLLWERSTDDEL